MRKCSVVVFIFCFFASLNARADHWEVYKGDTYFKFWFNSGSADFWGTAPSLDVASSPQVKNAASLKKGSEGQPCKIVFTLSGRSRTSAYLGNFEDRSPTGILRQGSGETVLSAKLTFSTRDPKQCMALGTIVDDIDLDTLNALYVHGVMVKGTYGKADWLAPSNNVYRLVLNMKGSQLEFESLTDINDVMSPEEKADRRLSSIPKPKKTKTKKRKGPPRS